MNRDALVVGINQYPFLKDTPTSKAKHLSTPANDAEAIAQRLEEYGGFRVRRLPETIQEGQRRVAAGMLVQTDALEDAIIRLFNPEGESVPETALLYFGGHGLRKNRGGVTEGFLATSDTCPQKNQWGVSLRWLRELLQQSPVRQQIVWLDCCYSGELLNFAEADLGTAGQDRTRFLIAAAREFEVAEGDIQGQHGVFSQALWEGLEPSKQPDGVVNNDKLIEYITQVLKDVPQQPIWYNPNREIILTGEREQVFIATPSDVCPYKGLRFFDVEDATYFYGREVLTQKLIERVQIGKGNFLAVLGVSGSGKSSLLRAGLIYQLQQERRLPGTEEWKIRIFTPGEQPLVSLATAFLDEDVTDIERAKQLREADEAIAQGATGLARLIRVSKSPRTLLIVDQFEEVFTVCQNPTDRQQFISSLLGTLKLTGDKLCLIFAMRDDFLGKCAAYPELTDLMIANLVMVTPMSPEELRRAIREPAQQLGRKVEENLINAILKDLGVEAEQQTREPEPGMLPLLSYTLEQLWQRQTLNWLKLDSYNRLGGVQKTLENLAEQAYKKLSVEEQRVADQIFIKLTQLGEGTPDTRKQVPQKDLVTQAESADLVERVIQKLAEAKLIVTSEQRKGQEKVAVVDVAHEALIRHWSRLRELLDNNREAIRTERKIQTAADEWRDRGKSKDYLLTGLRLGEAEKFLQDDADIVPLSGLAHEFVKTSIKRKHNNFIRLVGTVTGIIASLTGLTIFANIQRLEAEIGRINTLSESSKTLFASNKEFDALMESLRAGIKLKGTIGVTANTRWQVVTALQQAVYGIRERNRLEGVSVSFSPDNQMMAITSADGTVKLWSRDGRLLRTFERVSGPVSFSPDSKTIVLASKDNTVQLWGSDGTFLKTLQGHNKAVSNVSFSPNGKTIVSASEDETVKFWSLDGTLLKTLSGYGWSFDDVKFRSDGQIIAAIDRQSSAKLWSRDGTLLKLLENVNISCLDFSPDGKTIVTGDPEGRLKLWSHDGKLLKTWQGHGFVRDVSFSPDGKMIASASGEDGQIAIGKDNTVKLWNPNGDLLQTFRGHESGVGRVSFSPDGKIIASVSWDNTVKLWHYEGIPIKKLEGHSSNDIDISFSPDDQTLATASGDEVKLWKHDGIMFNKLQHKSVKSINFISAQQIVTFADETRAIKLWSLEKKLIKTINFDGNIQNLKTVSFSHDGKIIALGSGDSLLLLNYNGTLLKKLDGHSDDVLTVSFSPDGKIIASANYDDTIKLWQIEGGLLKTLKMNIGGVAAVSFSPNGKIIASGGAGGIIKLWTLDGREFKAFRGHSNWVNSLSFSPDGQTLASVSIEDNTVKLWGLDGKELITLQITDLPSKARFSYNGKTLAVAYWGGTVILWNFDLDDLLVHGCDWVRDYLKKNPNVSESDRHLCDGIGTKN